MRNHESVERNLHDFISRNSFLGCIYGLSQKFTNILVLQQVVHLVCFICFSTCLFCIHLLVIGKVWEWVWFRTGSYPGASPPPLTGWMYVCLYATLELETVLGIYICTRSTSENEIKYTIKGLLENIISIKMNRFITKNSFYYQFLGYQQMQEMEIYLIE